MQYFIEYGVGGGYNDISYCVIEAETQAEAEKYAHDSSIIVFESYGIFEKNEDDEDDDQEELSEADKDMAYEEAISSWCIYSAVEYNPTIHDEMI